MPIVPISEFMPDMPDLPSTGSDAIFNVVPLTAISYGPMTSHQPFSSAISARCQGGISMTDTAGNVRVFAGDVSKLYRISPPGVTPADVSKAGGYTTSTNGQWSFAQFNNRIIATNFNNPIQSYVDGTSTLFSDMITTGLTSLRAKSVTVVKNWVVLGNTTDATFGDQPQRVHWLAINDPTNAPTPGTQAAVNNLSDFQDIPSGHGALQGIAGNLGTSDAAIFFERAIWRMIYTGLPDIFSFVPAQRSRGLFMQGGLCQFGEIAYYWGEDGFYAFDGSGSQAIGKSKIDRFVLSDFQSSFPERVSCAADPSRGLLFWAYPGVGAINGNPNRLLCYSPFLDRWTITDSSSVNIEYLMRAATFGKTLEQLDSFGTLDALPYTLDSATWSGARSLLGAFDSQHRYGYFEGSNLAATITTTDFEPVTGVQSSVTRIRPLIDSTTATLAGAGRDAVAQHVTYGSDQAQEANGSCAMRVRGRYQRYRLKTTAGASWTQFSGLDVEEVNQGGTR
jgi:hypothetical protein